MREILCWIFGHQVNVADVRVQDVTICSFCHEDARPIWMIEADTKERMERIVSRAVQFRRALEEIRDKSKDGESVKVAIKALKKREVR